MVGPGRGFQTSCEREQSGSSEAEPRRRLVSEVPRALTAWPRSRTPPWAATGGRRGIWEPIRSAEAPFSARLSGGRSRRYAPLLCVPDRYSRGGSASSNDMSPGCLGPALRVKTPNAGQLLWPTSWVRACKRRVTTNVIEDGRRASWSAHIGRCRAAMQPSRPCDIVGRWIAP